MNGSSSWVLITGGATRLGRELCLAFAQSGWDVICHYHQSHTQALQTQAAVRHWGRECLLACANLALPDAPIHLLAQCAALCGGVVRCVVNNASIFEADEPQSCTAQTLLAHFQTNTAAPLLLGNALHAQAQACATHPPGWHSIVHVLDQKVHNLNPDYFSYTISKLALAHSVALQAQALAPAVRVCGLSPGLIYLSGPQTPDNFQRASQVNLLGQPIDPAHVARCAVFIAENNSLNGCTLRADNGQHLVPLRRDVMWAIDEDHHP